MPIKRIKSLYLSVYEDFTEWRKKRCAPAPIRRSIGMNTATRYAADVAIKPAQVLSMHRALPTTTQEITRHIGQFLTVDERPVYDMARD